MPAVYEAERFLTVVGFVDRPLSLLATAIIAVSAVSTGCTAIQPVETVLKPAATLNMVGETTATTCPMASSSPTAEATLTAGTPDVVETIPAWPVPTNLPDKYAIQLQVCTIDTRAGELPLPDALRVDGYQPGEDGYYIVQFVDVISSEWRNQLDSMSVARLGYVPNNAFLVRMTSEQRDTVAALDVVQWVGIYQPAYRISPDLPVPLEGRSTLIVLTFPGADFRGIKTQLQEWGGKIEASSENEFGGKVRITTDLRFVIPIARLNGVMWIEPWIEPGLSTS
jgi:hypothetical protein